MPSFVRRVDGETFRAAYLNELQSALEAVAVQGINVRDLAYGAVMDGTTDDRTPLLAAIAAASAAGGGIVFVPSGALAFTGVIDIPNNVNVLGAGNGKIGAFGATRFKCLDSAAQLKLGVAGTGSRGGRSGDFLIDGNNLSPTPLFLGRTTERTFVAIDVYNAASGGAAVMMQESQNNTFIGLNIEDCRGDGLMLAAGAAGNLFLRLESSGNGITASGGYGGAAPVHLRFTCIGAAPASLLAYANDNVFVKPIFERDGGNLSAYVHHGAGNDNYLLRPTVSHEGMASDIPLVRMAVDDAVNANISSDLHLHAPRLTGGSGATLDTAIDLNNSSSVNLHGRAKLVNLKYAYRLRDSSSRVRPSDFVTYSNVGTRLDPASVGTLGAGVRTQFDNPIEQTLPASTDVAHQILVAGEAGLRMEIRPDLIRYMDGSSFTPDTAHGRQGADHWGTSSGDQISAGGSIYSRATTTQTGDYTALITDYCIRMNNTVGSNTVTLPALSGLSEGFEFLVKRVGTQNVVVDGNASETIDTALTKTITTALGFLHIRKAGTVWDIVASGGTIT